MVRIWCLLPKIFEDLSSAVHAAAPYTNRMNIGSSWDGYALPDPPAGRGMGKPGFPIPLLESQALPRAGA